MCSINVEEGTIKLRKIEKRLIQGKKEERRRGRNNKGREIGLEEQEVQRSLRKG